MMLEINEIEDRIDKLQTSAAIDQLYAVLKRKQERLNKSAAVSFRLGQVVNFNSQGSRWSGEVESIGKGGKIKVKLSNSGRYSHYNIGAAHLYEGIIRNA